MIRQAITKLVAPTLLRKGISHGFRMQPVFNFSKVNHNMDGTSFHGHKFVRRLDSEEIELMQEAFKRVSKLCTFQEDEISWYNISTNGNMNPEKDQFWIKFDKFVKETVIRDNESRPQNIASYGFLYNPPKATKNQFYHIDFDPKMCIMFITMVPHTSENAAQFLSKKANKSPVHLGLSNHKFGDTDTDLLDFLEEDYLQVSQIICRPYCLLKGAANTVHRGIANRTDTPRPLFWVNYSETDYKVKDNVTQSFTKRVDREEQGLKKAQQV